MPAWWGHGAAGRRKVRHWNMLLRGDAIFHRNGIPTFIKKAVRR